MSTKGDEETEKDAETHNDSDIGEEDEKEETRSLVPFSNSNGAVLGRTVTLQMLLAAKILQPGKSAMTIEYLGQKFVGDLLPDGKIKSQETETVFCSPSAWAIHCKRIINPDKKSGCGWASVKYKGKKLDAYKAAWVRKCQLKRGTSPCPDPDPEPEKKEEAPEPIKRIPVTFNTISDRTIAHDGNTLVEVVPFSILGRPQPFLVSVATSAVLLLDFHCHLTNREVCGYLGGSWDPQAQRLSITHTFPCRNSRHDREKSGDVEMSIQKAMLEKNVSLVGWYHSHPKCGPYPSLRDCDAQMDYEIRMRGPSEASYAPIIGIICAPYNEDNPTMESAIVMYWVIPPPENKPSEYGRPMQMSYSVTQDEEMTDDMKNEMLQCIEYYQQFDNELIRFSDIYRDDVTYIEKMKVTLYPKFARKQDNREFWNWVRVKVGLEEEKEFVVPKTVIDQMLEKHQEMLRNEQLRREAELKSKDDGVVEKNSHEESDMKVGDRETEEAKQSGLNATDKTDEMMDAKEELKGDRDDKQTPLLSQISSLQEQLNLPSGLNMNPSTLATALVIPHVAGNSNMSSNASSATNTNSSPRDSPITIPSSSASPAKFEIPIRASPSPAKSDASSSRTRNSPAQSPAKFNVNDVLRNSPCRTPNNQHAPPVSTSASTAASLRHDNNPPAGTSSLKYDSGGPAAAAANMNELFAASLAQLAKTLPPGLLTNDYAALFQQTPAKMANDYYSMAAAAAAAAAMGNGKGTSSSSRSNSNLKDLMQQFNKNDLSYMMQSQYNPMLGMTPPRQEPKTNSAASTSSRSNSKSSRSNQSARTSKYLDSQAIPASSKSQQQQQQRLAAGYESLRAAEANRQLADFMKSTEYASLLLQQSGALGFNPTPTPPAPSSGKKSRSKAQSNAQAMPSMADLSSLLQATSKIPDLSSFFGATGTGKQSDFTQFLQQSVAPPVTSMASNSAASRKAAADLSSFYGSKLPDLTTITPVSLPSTSTANNLPHLPSMADFSALFAPVLGAGSSGKKGSSSNSMPTNDMLGTLLQAGKMNDINSLLFPASNGSGKMSNMSNLSNYFSTPMGAGKSDAMSLYPNISATATTSTASSSRRQKQEQRQQEQRQQEQRQQEQRQQEQELAALYQHMKYPGLPDPLSKSTLAANNMYMSPSAALLKMQQEALSAMMMKPPKSTSTSSSTSSTATSRTPDILSIPPSMSPIPERLLTATPSKSSTSSSSSRGNSPHMSPNPTKYNFSAVDLAISAVPSSGGTSMRTPTSSSSLMATDLSAKKLYSPANSYGTAPVKKRMEFSSIADLVAPPPTKMQKLDEQGHSDADDSGILNLSSNCK